MPLTALQRDGSFTFTNYLIDISFSIMCMEKVICIKLFNSYSFPVAVHETNKSIVAHVSKPWIGDQIAGVISSRDTS